MDAFEIAVPEGVSAGQQLQVCADGRALVLTVPPTLPPSRRLRFRMPPPLPPLPAPPAAAAQSGFSLQQGVVGTLGVTPPADASAGRSVSEGASVHGGARVRVVDGSISSGAAGASCDEEEPAATAVATAVAAAAAATAEAEASAASIVRQPLGHCGLRMTGAVVDT